MLKTGAPWRDLPQRYGDWENVHEKFSQWANSGVFGKLLEALTDQEQTGLPLIDSSVVKADQHAAGAKNQGESEVLGRSRGGWSSKIHGALNGQGFPLSLY